MTKTIFDPSVQPRCEYCFHCADKGGTLICGKTGRAAEAPCRRYLYDPTLRKPLQHRRLPSYSPDSFRID
ncbi:MAG: hypothetical protein E7559_05970 [Ruminococcaceae bacterium]|nr:hypothetical protein [Oscillospiraceae bacterium]